MREKIKFYLLFIILLILEITLINFVFPLFISISLSNGTFLTRFIAFGAPELMLPIARRIAFLWTLIAVLLCILVLLISQFFNKKDYKKIYCFSRILSIYSLLAVIFIFILICYTSNFVRIEGVIKYSIANFFYIFLTF